MKMAVEERANGHTIRVGDFDSGQGIRIHIDGTDCTDDLQELFPRQENPNGIPVPYGQHRIATEVKRRIVAGDITFNDD